MGRAGLKIEIDNAIKKTAEFIRFLDSLGFDPDDLPRDDMRSYAEADAFLRNYLEILSASKYVNPQQLDDAEKHAKKLNEITRKARASIVNHVLENLATPVEEQFKDYNAYARAERAWHRYGEFIKKHRMEQFSLERMQALIDRSESPELLFSVFFSFLDGSKVEKFDPLQEALYVIGELLLHTPRSGLSSKTLYQKGKEDRDKQINSLKEERNTPSFSDYDFNGLFNKLGSRDIQERKDGEKLLDQLWKNYVDEKHGRIKVEDKKHHKNIIALWDEMKRRFYQARSADEKMLALRPLSKIRCTFIPSRFYDEVKELILKGILDDSGKVRYRTVRVIDSVASEIFEHSPKNLQDLLDAIKDKRDAYVRENKLTASRRTNPKNIKDKTLRSLTQGIEFLEYYSMRWESISRIL